MPAAAIQVAKAQEWYGLRTFGKNLLFAQMVTLLVLLVTPRQIQYVSTFFPQAKALCALHPTRLKTNVI